jgi:hypothetical protein
VARRVGRYSLRRVGDAVTHLTTETRTAIRGRVACALSKPLAGDERPDALRWLGGLRRLDGLVLPIGVRERARLDDEAA